MILRVNATARRVIEHIARPPHCRLGEITSSRVPVPVCGVEWCDSFTTPRHTMLESERVTV